MTTRCTTLLLLSVAALAALGVPGAAPAGADDVPAGGETAARCFVDSAHRTFLARAATTPELEEWVEAFDDGTPDHVLIQELAGSDEWLAVTVDGIYRLALEREAEPGGLAYWVGELRDGALVNRIGAQIFGSAEFYGIAGGTDEGFVEALYDRILGRAPDSTGLAFWVGQVDVRGRGGVASEFYASYESRAMRVDGLYQELLDRDPEPSGLAYWVDRLRTVNDVELAVLIASSSEFADRTRERCPFAVAVATDTLPAGAVGVAYDAPLAATGGTPPYTWTATGLPTGLAVSGQQITGTPTAAGSFVVEVEVTDAEGGTEQADLDLEVVATALTITTSELPDTRAAVPFSGALAATGGTPPHTWTATGLPAGLTLSAATVTGSTTEIGVHAVELTVEDAAGQEDSAEVTFEIVDATTEIEAGLYHTCAAMAGGSVRCWGFNGQGQVGGVGFFSTPFTVPGLADATDVAAGAGHSCAVTGGQVRCWGADNFGALGDGATVAAPGPVTVSGLTDAVAVDAEENGTCALRSNQRVSCWGAGTRGQMGDGDLSNRESPVEVGGLTDAEQVAVGPDFACALRATGAVMCWGADDESQLGDANSGDSHTPVTVAGVTDAVAISAGANHACALLGDDTMACWGGNDDGQLGDGSTTEQPTPVALGLTRVVAIGAGIENTCSVRANGAVRCWGTTEQGALGQGTIPPTPTAQSTPLLVPGISDGLTVELGDRNVYMRSVTDVRAWGHNGGAQLGDGSATARPSPVTILGI